MVTGTTETRDNIPPHANDDDGDDGDGDNSPLHANDADGDDDDEGPHTVHAVPIPVAIML
jgi:hypothetical protein